MEDELKEGIVMKVDREFKDICDEFKSKVNEVAWNALDISDREITKILARKIKTARII